MRILITGTPGTGKTSVAKSLNFLLGWEVFHINDLIEEAVEERKKTEKTVDLEKAEKILIEKLKGKEDAIIEGHLGCDMKLPVDLVVVLRSDPELLKQRYKERKYSKKKAEDNIMVEVLDYCVINSEENYDVPVVQLNTTKRDSRACARIILDILSGRTLHSDQVDWSEYLRNQFAPKFSRTIA